MISTHPPMIRRRDATIATIARFQGQPFSWGRFDCARLAAFQARQLGWAVRIAKAGSYASALGAKRALARLGVSNLSELIDAHAIPRIAPAAALLGDLIEIPADDEEPGEGFGALTVALGMGRVLGWHPEVDGAAVLHPLVLTAAWRLA